MSTVTDIATRRSTPDPMARFDAAATEFAREHRDEYEAGSFTQGDRAALAFTMRHLGLLAEAVDAEVWDLTLRVAKSLEP